MFDIILKHGKIQTSNKRETISKDVASNTLIRGKIMKVIKRDGTITEFDDEKVRVAIGKANIEVRGKEKASEENIEEIVKYIRELRKNRILVEDIQDIIEEKLMEFGKYNLARKYITYRYTRALIRKSKN